MAKLVRDNAVNGGTVVDTVRMKELLALHKVDGHFITSTVGGPDDFAAIFKSMKDVDPTVWEEVYHELVGWSLDDGLRREHRNHQRRFKNKLLSNDEGAEEEKDGHHDITVFDDITRMSVRHDIDYSNSEEGREWKQYRHRLKCVFKVFAGTNAATMKKREFKRFLAILDVKQFWSLVSKA